MKRFILSLLAALAALLLFYVEAAAANGAGAQRVVVLPLTPLNAAAQNADNAWIGPAMQQILMADLAHTPGITPVSRNEKIATDAGGAISAGLDAGARIVVWGSYQIVGEQIRLTGMVVDVRTGEVRGAAKVTGTVQELLKAEDGLSDQVRQAIMGEAAGGEMPGVAAGQGQEQGQAAVGAATTNGDQTDQNVPETPVYTPGYGVAPDSYSYASADDSLNYPYAGYYPGSLAYPYYAPCYSDPFYYYSPFYPVFGASVFFFNGYHHHDDHDDHHDGHDHSHDGYGGGHGNGYGGGSGGGHSTWIGGNNGRTWTAGMTGTTGARTGMARTGVSSPVVFSSGGWARGAGTTGGGRMISTSSGSFGRPSFSTGFGGSSMGLHSMGASSMGIHSAFGSGGGGFHSFGGSMGGMSGMSGMGGGMGGMGGMGMGHGGGGGGGGGHR